MKAQAAKTDRWIKCLATGGNIRAIAVQATRLTGSMAQMHGFIQDRKTAETQAMAEITIAGLLIAASMKEGERVNVQIQSDGLVKQAFCDSYPEGFVRAFTIANPTPTPPVDPTRGPWGNGVLAVLRTKFHEGKQPYVGNVPLLTGHLAKDLTYYWFQSEQVPTAIGIQIALDPTSGEITSAGGFLVQALPDATPEERDAVSASIEELGNLAELFAHDAELIEIMADLFHEKGFQILEEKQIQFRCDCTLDKVQQSALLLGSEELAHILAKDGHLDAACDFCSTKYKIDRTQLETLIEIAKKQGK